MPDQLPPCEVKIRSLFTFRTEGAFVLVEDHDAGMSVTNDAENVIAHLEKVLGLTGKRVLYCDTDRHWDELVVKDGRFAGFRILCVTGSWCDAVAMAERVGPAAPLTREIDRE